MKKFSSLVLHDLVVAEWSYVKCKQSQSVLESAFVRLLTAAPTLVWQERKSCLQVTGKLVRSAAFTPQVSSLQPDSLAQNVRLKKNCLSCLPGSSLNHCKHVLISEASSAVTAMAPRHNGCSAQAVKSRRSQNI